MLIFLSVLRHLNVNTKILVQERRDLLDGSSCDNVSSGDDKGLRGTLSWLMVSSLSRVSNGTVTVNKSTGEEMLDPKEAKVIHFCDYPVEYHRVRNKRDPFSEPFMLDPLDTKPNDIIVTSTITVLDEADREGIYKEGGKELQKRSRTAEVCSLCRFQSDKPPRSKR